MHNHRYDVSDNIVSDATREFQREIVLNPEPTAQQLSQHMRLAYDNETESRHADLNVAQMDLAYDNDTGVCHADQNAAQTCHAMHYVHHGDQDAALKHVPDVYETVEKTIKQREDNGKDRHQFLLLVVASCWGC